MKIKLAKALKLKNRMLTELNLTMNNILSYNSMPKDNEFPYESKKLLEEYESFVLSYVDLKASISNANVSVNLRIFQLSEYKNMYKKLVAMNTFTGTQVQRYGSDSIVYKCQMSIIEKDKYLKDLTKKIDNIQDELDYHNQTIEIELGDHFDQWL